MFNPWHLWGGLGKILALNHGEMLPALCQSRCSNGLTLYKTRLSVHISRMNRRIQPWVVNILDRLRCLSLGESSLLSYTQQDSKRRAILPLLVAPSLSCLISCMSVLKLQPCSLSHCAPFQNKGRAPILVYMVVSQCVASVWGIEFLHNFVANVQFDCCCDIILIFDLC